MIRTEFHIEAPQIFAPHLQRSWQPWKVSICFQPRRMCGYPGWTDIPYLRCKRKTWRCILLAKKIFAWHFLVVSRYDTVRLPVFAENLAPRLWQVSINMFKTHTVTYVLPKSTHNILVIQPTIKHNIAWTGMSPEQFLKIKDNSSPYLTPSNVGLPSNVQQNNLFDVNMWHVPKKHHQTSIHVVHVWHVNQ